jgi:hypothetical protein
VCGFDSDLERFVEIEALCGFIRHEEQW